MDWKEKAIKILKDSLYPIPSELNELDWKNGLSDRTDCLVQHLSVFANPIFRIMDSFICRGIPTRV